MFLNLGWKIFGSFALLSLISVVGLSSFFLQSSLEERERQLVDLLGSQIQIHLFEVSKQIESDKSLEEISRQMNISFYSPSGDSFLASRLPVDPESFEPLPPSGLIIKPCQSETGQAYLCASQTVPGSNTWILEAIPQSSLTEILVQESKEIALVASLSLLLALCLGWLLSNAIIRPLKSFTRRVENFSTSGKSPEPSKLEKRQDEIGRLARQFGEMFRKLKRREDELRLSSMQLVHSERLASLGQFGASIAHEVKNPLGSILAYTRQVLKRSTAPEDQEALQTVLREAERCQDILGRMLRFSKQTNNQHKSFVLNEVLESSILLMKSSAQDHRTHFKQESESDLLCSGNPQETQQVLINLLLNAIEASPQGSEISVRVKSLDSHAHVIVSNPSEAMPKEIQERIFDPFFSTKGSERGSGLGLSVSRQIAQSQGGDLRLLESSENRTSFEFTVPLAKA